VIALGTVEDQAITDLEEPTLQDIRDPRLTGYLPINTVILTEQLRVELRTEAYVSWLFSTVFSSLEQTKCESFQLLLLSSTNSSS